MYIAESFFSPLYLQIIIKHYFELLIQNNKINNTSHVVSLTKQCVLSPPCVLAPPHHRRGWFGAQI